MPVTTFSPVPVSETEYEPASVFLCPRCRGDLDVTPGGARCRACSAEYPASGGILNLGVGSTAQPGFDPHYFKGLSSVEEAHFWFLSRRRVILDALRRSVTDLDTRPLFDIGCGSGGLLGFLAASGLQVAGACDAYAEALQLAHARVDAPFALVDEGRLPPLRAGQRLVGMFDVLEHMDDDAGVLAWVASVLEPGGVLVLTVPAHPFLFDEMDRLACHRRRYRRAELRERLQGAGLEVRTLTHFMAPLVPMLVAARVLGKLLLGRWRSAGERRDAELRVVPGMNGLLALLLRAERAWLRHATLPFGSSLLAIAARPAPAGA